MMEVADEDATASGRGEAHAVPSGMLPDAASPNGSEPVDMGPPKKGGESFPHPEACPPGKAATVGR